MCNFKEPPFLRYTKQIYKKGRVKIATPTKTDEHPQNIMLEEWY